MTSATWVVRAGRNALYLDGFLEKGVVAVGWAKLADLSGYSSQKELLEAVKVAWPDWKPGKQSITASQLYRFTREIAAGDTILTYDPERRVYHVGCITNDYQYKSGVIEDNPNVRPLFTFVLSPGGDLPT